LFGITKLSLNEYGTEQIMLTVKPER